LIRGARPQIGELMKAALLAGLSFLMLAFVIVWVAHLFRTRGRWAGDVDVELGPQLGIGFITNFMDTLGIGSFAPTTAIYKLLHIIPDDLIPGTINVGGVLPVILEAFIFIAIVVVDPRTLTSMIGGAILGAWFGAGMVCQWPKRWIQIGLGMALLVAAFLTLGTQLRWYPTGGNALALTGIRLWIAVGCNFMFAAFMQLGVGLYAPCMILVYLLGMSPRAAFPIMMGSCAFLMPVGSYRFVVSRRYSAKAALGLTIGGIPAILLAAYVVRSLPLGAMRWLVVFVAFYTSTILLRSASKETGKRAKAPTPSSQARQQRAAPLE
jgi:uncharacterized membrane protein YfcA